MQSYSHITPSSMNTPIFVAKTPPRSQQLPRFVSEPTADSESLRVLLHELPL